MPFSPSAAGAEGCLDALFLLVPNRTLATAFLCGRGGLLTVFGRRGESDTMIPLAWNVRHALAARASQGRAALRRIAARSALAPIARLTIAIETRHAGDAAIIPWGAGATIIPWDARAAIIPHPRTAIGARWACVWADPAVAIVTAGAGRTVGIDGARGLRRGHLRRRGQTLRAGSAVATHC